MAGKVEELQKTIAPEDLADAIVASWERYRQQSIIWRAEQKELRDYLFATDTTKTNNQDLPWRNSTTMPKLTQIRDNLHANYISALFPNDEWLRWEGAGIDDSTKEKAEAIESYMQNKIREGDFRQVISRLLLDYIDTGNAFADVVWVSEKKQDPATGEELTGYIGPKVIRFNPYTDIMINPTAAEFRDSPKLTRQIMTIGELKLAVHENPSLGFMELAVLEADERRSSIRNGEYSVEDFDKAAGYAIDGFGSLHEYYQSFFTELLTLEGDIHDPKTGEFLHQYVITVMDRTTVIRKEPMKTWLPKGTKAHASWRKRTDNLYGMGPLNNLVGMQYRIDHLENLKADVFDLIAFPPLIIKGEVEEFDWAPRSEIHLDSEDSSVEMLVPDTSALLADNQIALLEARMEEYAGAPKQAMGIRTPGEKTAFEVQQLENAAGRIFQEKIQSFEIELLEPILNSMLEVARRNLEGEDLVRVYDSDFGSRAFIKVTRDDITASGKLRPVGARHFAAQAQLVQNLAGIFNTPVGDVIAPHLSGKAMARLIEDVFGLERFQLFQDNVAVTEAAETASLVSQAQETLEVEEVTPTAPVPEEEIE